MNAKTKESAADALIERVRFDKGRNALDVLELARLDANASKHWEWWEQLQEAQTSVRELVAAAREAAKQLALSGDVAHARLLRSALSRFTEES